MAEAQVAAELQAAQQEYQARGHGGTAASSCTIVWGLAGIWRRACRSTLLPLPRLAKKPCPAGTAAGGGGEAAGGA